MGSSPTTGTSSSQAPYRLRRAFFKSQSALMPLLLLSKSQPLTLGCDLVSGANLKTTASILLQYSSSSYAHSAAPPLQTTPAALGFDLVLGTNLKTLSCILLGYSAWPQSSLCCHVFFIIDTNPHCSTPLSKLIPYCYRYLVDICSPACYNWFTKVDRREGEQWSIPH